MKAISPQILLKVDSIINKYKLFTDNIAVVAYSGGKDSLFLCRCLVELGFNVIPIIIDIGFKNDWNNAIQNITDIGLNAYLLDTESIDIDLRTKKTITTRFNEIKDIKAGKFRNVSPCTPCYNAKMTLLAEWAKQNNIRYVAMGHHGTDAIASMLKSYFMYYDRWREDHIEYNNDNFMKIIQQHKTFFQIDRNDFINSFFYSDLKKQIINRNAGTDEAILQEAIPPLTICRPLYEVMEYEILTYYSEESIAFNHTECFFRNLRDDKLLTPREMVQYTLLRDARPDILSLLMELNHLILDDTGRLIVRVRNNRDKILGISYKTKTINAKKI